MGIHLFFRQPDWDAFYSRDLSIKQKYGIVIHLLSSLGKPKINEATYSRIVLLINYLHKCLLEIIRVCCLRPISMLARQYSYLL